MERVILFVAGVALVWWLMSLVTWQRRRREPTAWDVLMHRPGTDWQTGRPLDRSGSDASSAAWGTVGDAGCSSDTDFCDW